MHTYNKGSFGQADGSGGFSDWFQDPAPPTDPGAGWTQGGPNATPGPATVETAAVGDLGTIASLARGRSSDPSSPTTSGASLAPTDVTTQGSGLVIDLDWDSSVGSAPAGFVSDVIAAAQFLESQITTAVTVNLDVGYDEIDGSALESGALGESESNIESVNYSSLVAALKASSSTDPTDASVLASLPATSPVGGTIWVTTAQAKALGLTAANGTGLDGAIGFGASSEFTYGDTNTSGTVASGTYDFFATATHEMTETMGRIMLVGGSVDGAAGYTLMDLLHYSAPGTRDLVQSTPGYFSANAGATNLGELNTIAGGDPGDWATSVADNSFDAYATPGVPEPVTANDLTEMDALGWNLAGSATTTPTPPPASPPTVTDQTASQSWTEGRSIDLELPANTFTDPQGESLTYAASQANGQALPSWLTFNATTETFTGTAPSSTQSLSLKVTATDTSGLSASETFAANVVAPAPEPAITVTNPTPNLVWTDGQNIDYVLPRNTFTDALGLKMTFAAYEVAGTNVTSWLRFNGTTETFTGKVPANEPWAALLEVVATDADHATATDLIAVTFAAPGASHPAASLVNVSVASTAPGHFGEQSQVSSGMLGNVFGHS